MHLLPLALILGMVVPAPASSEDEEGGGPGRPPAIEVPDIPPSEARSRRPPTLSLPAQQPPDLERLRASRPPRAGIPNAARPEDMQGASDNAMVQMMKADPKAYAQQRQVLERQGQIRDIVARVRQGEMSREEGEKRLFPLVEKDLPNETGDLDQRIARLKKELALLEAAKKTPDVLVRKRVDELLGKGQAEPPTAW